MHNIIWFWQYTKSQNHRYLSKCKSQKRLQHKLSFFTIPFKNTLSATRVLRTYHFSALKKNSDLMALQLCLQLNDLRSFSLLHTAVLKFDTWGDIVVDMFLEPVPLQPYALAYGTIERLFIKQQTVDWNHYSIGLKKLFTI